MFSSIATTVISLLLAAGAAMADMPGVYGFERVTGRIERIQDFRIWDRPCRVIHLRESSGCTRAEATAVYRQVLEAGYQGGEKRLRHKEVVIVLPKADAKALQPSEWIEIGSYRLLSHGNGHVVSEGHAERLRKIDKPTKASLLTPGPP